MSKARDLSAFVSTPADAGSSVKLKEGSDNGSNFIELKSPASLAADVTFVMPSADGTNGQALTTNGSGALAWSTVGGTPGGSDTQIQYNSSGSFAGASGLVTDGSNLTINAQGDLRFADSDSSNWVAFQAPATIASNVTWTLPDADGTDGQVMKTNGSGTLSWITPASGGGGGGTSVTVTQVTATASQTTFSVTYTVGQLSVYLNGALLSSSDYTASNGTSVVLASGAASGDIFTAVAYDSSSPTIVNSSYTSSNSSSSATTTGKVTLLTVNYTPASASNKLLIVPKYNLYGAVGGTETIALITLERGGSEIFSNGVCIKGNSPLQEINSSFSVLDSPNTTSQVTYTLVLNVTRATGGTSINSGGTTGGQSRLNAMLITELTA